MKWGLVAFHVAACAVVGCGSDGATGESTEGASTHDTRTDTDAGTDTRDPSGAAPTGSFESDASSDDGSGNDGCSRDGRSIYVIGANRSGKNYVDHTLFRFDPETSKLSKVGPLPCLGKDPSPSPLAYFGEFHGLAIDRNDVGWTIFRPAGTYLPGDEPKQMFAKFDIKGGSCEVLSAVRDPEKDFVLSSPAFVRSGTNELLYAREWGSGQSTEQRFVTVEPSSMTTTSGVSLSSADARGVLFGTGDGRLFVLSDGRVAGGNDTELSVTVAPIDLKTGKPTGAGQTFPLSSPRSSIVGTGAAYWGGDFWVLEGDVDNTHLLRLESATATSKVVVTDFGMATVVAIASSTCTPVNPIN